MKATHARIIFFVVLIGTLAINGYPYYLHTRVTSRISVDFVGLMDSEGKAVGNDFASSLIQTVKENLELFLGGEKKPANSGEFFAKVNIHNSNERDLAMVECVYEVKKGNDLLARGHFIPATPFVFHSSTNAQVLFPIKLMAPARSLEHSLYDAEISGRAWIAITKTKKLEVPFRLDFSSVY